MTFPQFISFTVTNSCNLRCKMCGQWGEEGYINNRVKAPGAHMDLADWKRLVDEVSEHPVRCILIRGGEPFLYPGIMDLVKYINSKGIFLSIDTNGTELPKFAHELAGMKNIHITFSVDGPEEVHDAVRGVTGSFQKTRDAIALLADLEKGCDSSISKSICFTISRYSYTGLGRMPDVARSMGIDSINIVPYYYFSDETGKKYEEELNNNLHCSAFSWKGFHHETSGIDFDLFVQQYEQYLENLNGIENFPYLPLSVDEYKTWFSDESTIVGSSKCNNIEKLVDIQPDGETNFCVDFPDYSLGNINNATIAELWNSDRAEEFRKYRREKTLAICNRCGAKYISEL